MKNAIRIDDDALGLVWGGFGMNGEIDRDDAAYIEKRYGHGKTQPGNNEDIFHKNANRW